MAKTQGSLDSSYSVGAISLAPDGTLKKNGQTVGSATHGNKNGKPVIVVVVPPQPPVVIPADDPNVPNVTDTVLDTANALTLLPPPAPVLNTTIPQTPATVAASSLPSDGSFFHVGPMYHGNHGH